MQHKMNGSSNTVHTRDGMNLEIPKNKCNKQASTNLISDNNITETE